MKIIAGPAHSGKTTRLVEIAAERGSGCYIICHSRREAWRVFTIARTGGHNLPFPLTHEEFIRREHGLDIREVLIDNIDLADDRLESMLYGHSARVSIVAVTMTADEFEWLGEKE